MEPSTLTVCFSIRACLLVSLQANLQADAASTNQKIDAVDAQLDTMFNTSGDTAEAVAELGRQTTVMHASLSLSCAPLLTRVFLCLLFIVFVCCCFCGVAVCSCIVSATRIRSFACCAWRDWASGWRRCRIYGWTTRNSNISDGHSTIRSVHTH